MDGGCRTGVRLINQVLALIPMHRKGHAGMDRSLLSMSCASFVHCQCVVYKGNLIGCPALVGSLCCGMQRWLRRVRRLWRICLNLNRKDRCLMLLYATWR